MNSKIIVTGSGWVGSGFESINTSFEQMVNQATNEIIIGVYSIGLGAAAVFGCLEEALKRNVRVVFVVNRFTKQNQAVRDWIDRLRHSYLHFDIYDFNKESDQEDFHVKAVIVDRNKAIIGSSNMSGRGLITNHELAVYVEGNIAEDAAKGFNKLIANRTITRLG